MLKTTILENVFEYKRNLEFSLDKTNSANMPSNRNDDFIEIFGKKMRSSWRKKAIRRPSQPQDHTILMPVDFENTDRRYFNISILMLMAFIGFVSYSLISFYSSSPKYDSQTSKSEEKFEITPAEYSELVMRIVSRLSNVKL